MNPQRKRLMMKKMAASSFQGGTKDGVVDPDVVIQFSWKKTQSDEVRGGCFE
jgi:hypothetical protein